MGRRAYALWEAASDAPGPVKKFIQDFIRVASFGFLLGAYIGAAKRRTEYFLKRLDNPIARRRLARDVEDIETTIVILSKLRRIDFIPQYIKKDIKRILRDIQHLRDCALEFSGRGTSWRVPEVDTTSEGEDEMVERTTLIDKISRFPIYAKVAMLVINGWVVFFLIAAISDFVGHPIYGMVG